jgi:sugar lactone lactonase YvrE
VLCSGCFPLFLTAVVFVMDDVNNRVLRFLPGTFDAVEVLGQDSMTSTLPGTSDATFSEPLGCAVDKQDNLYISDLINNRVMFFPKGSVNATRVYGQTNFSTSFGGCNARNFNSPIGIALDSNGNLFVADTSNNRVVVFPPGSTTPSNVIGQGSFDSCGSNREGEVGANTLSHPVDVVVDDQDGIFIVDSANTRVLYYPLGAATPASGGATLAYGQPNLNSTTSETSQTTITWPTAVAYDKMRSVLYVAQNSNRVSTFNIGDGVNQIQVFGQKTFTSSSQGTSAETFFNPAGMIVDRLGRLYVADASNNRVVRYGDEIVVGPMQGGSFESAIVPTWDYAILVGGTLRANESLTVLGTMTIQSVAEVAVNGVVAVYGTLIVQNQSRIASGVLFLGAGSVLELDMNFTKEPFLVTVAEFTSLYGTFGTVRCVVSTPYAACIAKLTYMACSVKAEVEFIRSCSWQRNLWILGVAIGCSAFVVIVCVVAALYLRRRISSTVNISEMTPILSQQGASVTPLENE